MFTHGRFQGMVLRKVRTLSFYRPIRKQDVHLKKTPKQSTVDPESFTPAAVCGDVSTPFWMRFALDSALSNVIEEIRNILYVISTEFMLSLRRYLWLSCSGKRIHC